VLEYGLVVASFVVMALRARRRPAVEPSTPGPG